MKLSEQISRPDKNNRFIDSISDVSGAGSLYAFLAFYMALSTLIAYIFLLETIIAVNLHSVICMTNGALSAVAASLYSSLTKNIKSEKISGNIRGGIIIISASYAFSSIFQPELMLPERFFPNQINISSAVCALYAWSSVISYRKLFNSRMQFNVIAKNYNGEKLKEKLFEDSSLLSYTNENIDKAQYNYFFQVVILGLLTLVCAILQIRLSLLLRLLLIFILAAGVCVYALFQIIKWEQFHAGEGINLSAGSRSKRLLAVITLTLSALILSMLTASNNNLLDFSLVIGFFIWLISLLKFPADGLEQAELNETAQDFYPAANFSYLEEIPPSPVWGIIMKYFYMFLKYSLIILAAWLFIRFMISPLLNRGVEEGKIPFGKKLKQIITGWFKGMLNALSSFIIQLKKEKIMRLNAEDINRAAESIFSAYSPAKRKDLKQSVTLFARLIVWGSRVRNVSWKSSLAPGEYCGILASSSVTDGEENNQRILQRQNENIIRCAEIFEKSLYSAEVLSVSEKNEFRELVEEITSVSASSSSFKIS